MDASKVLTIHSADVSLGSDGLVTIKSAELHSLVSLAKSPPLEVNSPPYGHGDNGNPKEPPPRPIIGFQISF